MFDGSLAERRDVPLMTLFVDEVLSLLAAAPSLEQFGAMMALRAVAWKAGGPLQDKPARLAGICKVSRRYWVETIRPGIVEFISVRDGYLRDDELERQHAAALKRVEAARQKGRLGGLATAAARTQRVQNLHELRKPNSLENNNSTPSCAGSKYNYRKEEENLPPTSDSLPAARAREATHAASIVEPVIDGGWPLPEPRKPPTPEEIAEVDRMLAEAAQSAAQAQMPPRVRAPLYKPAWLVEETEEDIAELARMKAQCLAAWDSATP